MKPLKLLFVCTGNICRSVMSELICRELAKERKLDNMEISSAGVDAKPEYSIYGNLELFLKDKGLDTARYKNTQITLEMIDRYDYIFVMEYFHYGRIMEIRENAKTFLLKEFAGEEGEIPDPIYEEAPDYAALWEKLRRYICLALDKILDSSMSFPNSSIGNL